MARVRGYNYMSIFTAHGPFTFFFGRSILTIICRLVVWMYFVFNTLWHDELNTFIVLELIIKCHIGDHGRMLFFNARGTFDFRQSL